MIPNRILLPILLGLHPVSQAAEVAAGNGSLETNSFTNPGFAGINGLWDTTAGAATGWTFTGNGRWFMQTDNGGNNFGAPQDGQYYVNLSLGGTSFAFSMSTALTGLTIGNNYAVEFYASERSGIIPGTSFSASVDTTLPTSLAVTEASLPAITTGFSNYVKQTLSFTATAESHTLTVSNTGTGSGGSGFLVDNFTIVDEPWVAADGVWTGGDGDWGNPANWQSATIGQGIDKSATFNGVAPVTAAVNINRPIGALIFSGADHTIAPGAGSLTLDGDSVFAIPTATVDSAITATIAATLNGSEGLLKNGNGTLVLSANNPYTGGTSVANGTLKLDLAGRTGTSSIGTFDVSSGATLNLDNTNTVLGGANEFYPANFILNGDGTLIKTNIGSIDFWTGSDLTGFTGTVDVQEGALRINNIGSGGTMGSATLNIASGATFDIRFNSSLAVDKLTGSGTLDQTFAGSSGLSVMVGSNDGSSTFDGVIQNSSGQPLALTKAGTGTLTLGGLNTYTGNTSIENGTLVLADNAQLKFVVTNAPASNMVTGSGTATFNGDFVIDTSAVSGTTGYIWTLVDRDVLTGESFEPSFSVVGFTDANDDGIWTMSDAKGDWSFDESTGELTLDVGNDYDDWGSAYGLAQGSEAGDLDNDGLTNEEEYAFGLIPDSGASVNPISVPLDKATGTFRYTRRATPAITGLTYTVWTSTDLLNWTEDAGATASQSVTGTVAGVETVEATISSALLTNAKLFIQVRAAN